ncbi:MAG: VOC family protein [Pseudomonadota bacterium]
MHRRFTAVTVLVPDYDDAIAFYVDCLGFTLLEDTRLDETKRWVRVAPTGDAATALVLAKAASTEQEARIGDQTGGRVFLFLATDDFDRDYALYQSRGARFLESPRTEVYGKVAVFADPFGNKWDLIEPA